MRACVRESDLVDAAMPLLRAARGFDEEDALADPCARALVNSENVKWLDALRAPLPPSQLRKPDLFATWAPFWSGRADAARGGAVGGLAHRSLQLTSTGASAGFRRGQGWRGQADRSGLRAAPRQPLVRRWPRAA